MTMEKASQPATAAEIARIIGEADGNLLNELKRIEPTVSEMREARALLDADGQMNELLEKTMNPRIRKVYRALKENRQGGCCGCCCG